MEKMDEIRQALIETYNKSFNLKEPTASLFSGIEVLMLMIDEDPEVILSQFDDMEIQMYNYLINEIIRELRKRNTENFNAQRIVRNVINIRKPRPITVQPNRNDWNRKIVVPNFEIPADLALLSVKPLAMDQRNLTSDLGNCMDERSLDIALQKNLHPPTSKNIDNEKFPSTSEIPFLRNLEESAKSIKTSEIPFLRNLEESAKSIKTPEIPFLRNLEESAKSIKTSEIQQFGCEEVLSDSSLPRRRIDLPSMKELSSKQPVQFDELEVNLPEIPPDDDFIQEFRALFERRRREKAAVDYAERATLRTKRSSTNLKYRDFSRHISHLTCIFDEAHIQREMQLFSQTSFSMSNQIQNFLISTSNQEWHQRTLIDRSLTDFSNLIANKPQSTPETPSYGKQTIKKWTSALEVLEEDQMDEVSGDQNQIIIQPNPIESHQTPLTAKNIQKDDWKLTNSKSSLPVLQDEIEPPSAVEIEPPPATETEPPPATEIEPPSATEIEPPPEKFVQENIQKYSKRSYTDVTTTENKRLIVRKHPAKIPKITTEKAYPSTEVQNLTDDSVFQQYLKSWKRSFLLNFNDMHRDIHFPVDLLKMLDFGTPVHQVLKKLVDSGDNQLNYFLPPTSTRKEAAKRIYILLELRTQNVLDFIVQDGEVTGVSIKH